MGTIIFCSSQLLAQAKEGAQAATNLPNVLHSLPQAAASATFTITYVGAWPTEAKTALEYAADNWSTLIISPYPIEVEAHWVDISAVPFMRGSSPVHSQGSGVPYPEASYPLLLRDILVGSSTANQIDIRIYASSVRTDWYFGTDGNTPVDQYDFATFALRSIGEGLGFESWLYVTPDNIGHWAGGRFTILDRLLVNGSGQQIIDAVMFPNGSAALGAQLTSNDLYFDGLTGRMANGGTLPQTFAPNSWEGDLSTELQFLDETAYSSGSPNALMTPVIGLGEANHHPGPVAIAMLEDMGWPAPPIVMPLPDQVIEMDSSHSQIIDLWAFVEDVISADSELNYQIQSVTDANVGVSISDNRFIDIHPRAGWSGAATIVVEMSDPGGLSSTQSFVITVAPELTLVYLPLVVTE